MNDLEKGLLKITRGDHQKLTPEEIQVMDAHLQSTPGTFDSTEELISSLGDDPDTNEVEIKYEGGHLVEVPDGLYPKMVIGGYHFAESEDGMYICGISEVNIATAPIHPVSISPITKEEVELNMSGPKQIGRAFEFDEDSIYYMVNIHNNSYVFKSITGALTFAGAIIQYKTKGLQHMIDQNRLEKEL